MRVQISLFFGDRPGQFESNSLFTREDRQLRHSEPLLLRGIPIEGNALQVCAEVNRCREVARKSSLCAMCNVDRNSSVKGGPRKRQMKFELAPRQEDIALQSEIEHLAFVEADVASG